MHSQCLKGAFKKKGNHCWSNIGLYFLSNTHGIPHVHENAQPCDGSLQKVNSFFYFCFLLALIQCWDCFTACGLFKVALCNLDKNVCQLPQKSLLASCKNKLPLLQTIATWFPPALASFMNHNYTCCCHEVKSIFNLPLRWLNIIEEVLEGVSGN